MGLSPTIENVANGLISFTSTISESTYDEDPVIGTVTTRIIGSPVSSYANIHATCGSLGGFSYAIQPNVQITLNNIIATCMVKTSSIYGILIYYNIEADGHLTITPNTSLTYAQTLYSSTSGIPFTHLSGSTPISTSSFRFHSNKEVYITAVLIYTKLDN